MFCPLPFVPSTVKNDIPIYELVDEFILIRQDFKGKTKKKIYLCFGQQSVD